MSLAVQFLAPTSSDNFLVYQSMYVSSFAYGIWRKRQGIAIKKECY